MSDLTYSRLESALGDIYIIAQGQRVSRIIFGKSEFDDFRSGLNGSGMKKGGASEELRQELFMYLDGRLSSFSTAIEIPEGTPFQKAVWKKLLDIPYGSVVTYKDVAESIGSPGAARAVGNAVGANPLPIVIPCHRVLAGKGLGGYSCGVHIKESLLRLEGALA